MLAVVPRLAPNAPRRSPFFRAKGDKRLSEIRRLSPPLGNLIRPVRSPTPILEPHRVYEITGDDGRRLGRLLARECRRDPAHAAPIPRQPMPRLEVGTHLGPVLILRSRGYVLVRLMMVPVLLTVCPALPWTTT